VFFIKVLRIFGGGNQQNFTFIILLLFINGAFYARRADLRNILFIFIALKRLFKPQKSQFIIYKSRYLAQSFKKGLKLTSFALIIEKAKSKYFKGVFKVLLK